MVLVPQCPACAGRLRPWRTVTSFEPDLGPRQLDLARCALCGSAVTLGDPVPDAHSSGAYSAQVPRLSRAATPLLERFDRRRLALLPPPPARLLDVGAGRGRFVGVARAAGYDAMGIEPSLRQPVVGLVEAGIFDFSVDAPVDVVTLWHVLEHLEDPAAALERLGSWLAPGGALLVGVPNLGSLQARLSGGRWYHLDLPRHRTHFTVRGLSALLSRSGFEVTAVEHAFLEHNPFGMWQSLVSAGTRRPSYLYNLLKHNAPFGSWDLPVTLAALPGPRWPSVSSAPRRWLAPAAPSRCWPGARCNGFWAVAPAAGAGASRRPVLRVLPVARCCGCFASPGVARADPAHPRQSDPASGDGSVQTRTRPVPTLYRPCTSWLQSSRAVGCWRGDSRSPTPTGGSPIPQRTYPGGAARFRGP